MFIFSIYKKLRITQQNEPSYPVLSSSKKTVQSCATDFDFSADLCFDPQMLLMNSDESLKFTVGKFFQRRAILCFSQ